MAGLPGTDWSTSVSAAEVSRLAARALWDEAWLTPKPGLVDSTNNGAHSDMDLPLLLRSVAAITPWLAVFCDKGRELAGREAGALMPLLRPQGLACEQAMFQATGGINTHKGGIFSLGLLCCAAGWLEGRGRVITCRSLCRTVSEMCRGLVARELRHGGRIITAGERLYRQFGLAGARGEAESGFLTVRRYVLPFWFTATDPRCRLLNALLRLMANNSDTNLVARGGLAGLYYVQGYAARLLRKGWSLEALRVMDAHLTARNLSPGGSADLLAVSAVLAGVSGITEPLAE